MRLPLLWPPSIWSPGPSSTLVCSEAVTFQTSRSWPRREDRKDISKAPQAPSTPVLGTRKPTTLVSAQSSQPLPPHPGEGDPSPAGQSAAVDMGSEAAGLAGGGPLALGPLPSSPS